MNLGFYWSCKQKNKKRNEPKKEGEKNRMKNGWERDKEMGRGKLVPWQVWLLFSHAERGQHKKNIKETEENKRKKKERSFDPVWVLYS